MELPPHYPVGVLPRLDPHLSEHSGGRDRLAPGCVSLRGGVPSNVQPLHYVSG